MIPATAALAATIWLGAMPCEDARPACWLPPAGWDALPRVTTGTNGREGDPVNVALIGRAEDVEAAFAAAGWVRPDRESLPSAVRTGEAVLRLRRYPQLPVSRLWLFGRTQDLAFAQPLGTSVARRHHIRLWRSPLRVPDGRPVWLGASTCDVGLHPLQLMHRIGRDVDAERRVVVGELWSAAAVVDSCTIPWRDGGAAGRNATGDPYATDGDLAVADLREAPAP